MTKNPNTVAVQRGVDFCREEGLDYEDITESKDSGVGIACFYFKNRRVILLFTDCKEDDQVGVWIGAELRVKGRESCESDFLYEEGLSDCLADLIEGKL